MFFLQFTKILFNHANLLDLWSTKFVIKENNYINLLYMIQQNTKNKESTPGIHCL